MARVSNSKDVRKARIKRRVKTTLWTVSIVLFVSITASAIIAIPRLNKAEAMIPDLADKMQAVRNTPSQIMSADGEVLYVVQNEYRDPITDISQVPDVVINATIAAEDKRFRDHGGVDSQAMAGVLWHYAVNRNLDRGGGSTLTMQIAKRIYTSPVQSIDRKLDDMALAIMIEHKLTKDQILELYLNQVYYGERAYGIGAAAETYFGKNLDELTLSEAATLARLVRRPSQENPFADKEKAIENRNVVLKLMLEQEFITKKEYESALEEELVLADQKPQALSGVKKAPYFVDSVLRLLKKDQPEIDLGMGGYTIYTTLNYKLQQKAEKIVKEAINGLKSQKVTTGAIVVLDSEGRIIAHVGGADYNRNQFDVVWQGARQPGSSFKPFMYATAFEQNVVTPHTMISNERYSWEKSFGNKVQVHNSDGNYGGPVSVEYAIKKSINVPAARVIEMVGPANVVTTAHRSFGFTSHLDAVPALALGATAVSPIEMARAYSVFKTGGDRLEPWQITRIDGPDGHTIKHYSPRTKRNVISRNTAKSMDTILWATAQPGGTAWRVTSNEGVVNAHGKTGTTNSYRDAWLCGYTDQFIAIAWVGSEVKKDGRWVYQPMTRVFGGTAVAPFWGKVVKEAQDIYGEEKINFRRYIPETAIHVDVEGGESDTGLPPLDPDNIPPIDDGAVVENPPVRTDPPDDGNASIVYRLVCQQTEALATAYCPVQTRMPYKAGKEPTERCPVHGPPRQ